MSRLTTEQELEVINAAIAAIQSQRAANAALRQQLGNLPAENDNLRAALADADAADAAGDAALLNLRDVIDAATEPPDGGEPAPDPGDPIDPPTVVDGDPENPGDRLTDPTPDEQL